MMETEVTLDYFEESRTGFQDQLKITLIFSYITYHLSLS